MEAMAVVTRADDRILFTAAPAHNRLTADLSRALGWPEGKLDIGRFPNRELFARCQTDVAGHSCVVLGSVAPPDSNLASFLLACHTLRRLGARRITALIPYLAYSRHDREKGGESLGAAWLGDLLKASGVSEVVTVDVHSRAAHTLFPIPVVSLSPASLFAAEVERLHWKDATVVAPDEGAMERCETVRAAARMARPVAYLEKERSEAGVRHGALHGEVGERAIIVDDILDTGGTLVSCCEALRLAGARDIVVMVTHALFTGERWKQLWRMEVREIVTTDTTPAPAHQDDGRIATLPVCSLLCRHFARSVERAVECETRAAA